MPAKDKFKWSLSKGPAATSYRHIGVFPRLGEFGCGQFRPMCSDIVFIMLKSRKSNGSVRGKAPALKHHQHQLRIQLSLFGRLFCQSFVALLTRTQHTVQSCMDPHKSDDTWLPCSRHCSIIEVNQSKDWEQEKKN